jgi:hypothetical protein
MPQSVKLPMHCPTFYAARGAQRYGSGAIDRTIDFAEPSLAYGMAGNWTIANRAISHGSADNFQRTRHPSLYSSTSHGATASIKLYRSAPPPFSASLGSMRN